MDIDKFQKETSNLYDFILELKTNEDFKINLLFYKECLFEWHKNLKIMKSYESRKKYRARKQSIEKTIE